MELRAPCKIAFSIDFFFRGYLIITMVITTISYEYHWRLEEAFDVSFEKSLNWVYGENIKFHKTEKDQRHTTELDSMLFRFGLVRSIVKSSIDCG